MIKDFDIQVATAQHVDFAPQICDEMAESAKARGTGIAQRSPEYVANKMLEGKAVIAFHKDGTWAGFCYIETWSHGDFVANSGLIVSPQFRKEGLAKAIKESIFKLSRNKYPNAKIFGLTTGLAVMKINSELGYEPVTYSELHGRFLAALLRAAKSGTPLPEVHIRADRQVRFEAVGRAILAAQMAGVPKVGFITEPRNESEE